VHQQEKNMDYQDKIVTAGSTVALIALAAILWIW